MATLKFRGIIARQSPTHQVVSVKACAGDIQKIARIERVARSGAGELTGFQRPLIARHIREIRDYLKGEEAILPNPIVLAFVGDSVEVATIDGGFCVLQVTAPEGEELPGFVVDGQQRLTALVDSGRTDFEVFVSVLVCRNIDELRQQFVLINNTRPLPKSLIYELLPTVKGLPPRFDSRTAASKVVEMLNFREDSALKGLILQHTKADGLVRDTVIQKMVLNSWNDGALRDFRSEEDSLERSYRLVNEFFLAVREVWPHCFKLDFKTVSKRLSVSRLLHGTSILALGFVMDLLVARTDASSRGEFEAALRLIADDCRWTDGAWEFSDGACAPFNSLQYTSHDISRLSHHLTKLMRQRLRERDEEAAPAGALEPA